MDSIAILIWENEVWAAFKGSLGRIFDSLTLSIRRKVSFEEKNVIQYLRIFLPIPITKFLLFTRYTPLNAKSDGTVQNYLNYFS